VGWWALQRIYQFTEKKSYRQLQRLADRLGAIAYRLDRSRQRLMKKNLRVILPDASEKEIDQIARRAAQNIFRGLLDLFYFSWHPEKVNSFVQIHVTPAARKAIQSDPGIIAATGHLGLFPLVISPQNWNGRPCGVLVKDPHDKRVADFFTALRTKFDIISINHKPPTTAARKTVGLLRKRGTVLLAFDLYPGEAESVEVNFFGRPTRMFSAPARFAARVGGTIVPSYVIRRQEGGYEVHLEDPIPVPPAAAHREEAVTVELIQQLADWIAEKIRSYPDQWWSIHRRWR